MTYFEWKPDYETGIAGIDYEHHRLVQLLNDVHRLIADGAAPSEISDTLAELHTIAAAHFALEERVLREEGHPEFEERRHLHYRLLDQVRDIMDAYEAGGYGGGESLPGTLREWLSSAIEMDAGLFAKINDAGLRRYGLNRG